MQIEAANDKRHNVTKGQCIISRQPSLLARELVVGTQVCMQFRVIQVSEVMHAKAANFRQCFMLGNKCCTLHVTQKHCSLARMPLVFPRMPCMLAFAHDDNSEEVYTHLAMISHADELAQPKSKLAHY